MNCAISGRSAGAAERMESVMDALCRWEVRLSNPLSREQDRECGDDERRLADHRGRIGPEGRGAANPRPDLIDAEQALQGPPQPADDSAPPVTDRVRGGIAPDPPHSQIDHPTVASYMRACPPARPAGRTPDHNSSAPRQPKRH